MLGALTRRNWDRLRSSVAGGEPKRLLQETETTRRLPNLLHSINEYRDSADGMAREAHTSKLKKNWKIELILARGFSTKQNLNRYL